MQFRKGCDRQKLRTGDGDHAEIADRRRVVEEAQVGYLKASRGRRQRPF